MSLNNIKTCNFTVKKWRILLSGALVALALICIMLLCSCAGQKAVLSESVSSNSVSGIVESVDNNVVKLSIMQGGQGGQGAPGDMQGSQGAPGDMQGGQGGTPPAKPDGESSGIQGQNSQGGTPPAMPGDNSQNSGGQNSQGGTPPAKPDGDNSGMGQGQAPGSMGQGQGQAPGGTSITLTINDASVIQKQDGSQGSMSDISQGCNLNLTVENGKNVTKIEISSGMGQGGNGNINNGSSATTFSSDTTKSNENFSSSSSDENAVRADSGSTATLQNCTFEKSGDSTSSEDSDFYGLNAIAYAWNNAKLILNGGTLRSSAKGANGVFVYGSGASAELKDLKIYTSQDNSGGIEVSGGGTINAENLDVETQGGSCAAIRSDRGGGTEVVNGGSYKAHGQGSPAIYCTADVTVNNAYLESETSEVNVIEGKNSIKLDGCTLNCNTSGKNHRGDNIRNIMLYQSMSGDAEQGTCSYSAKDCNYTANHGNIFYVTNTSAVINLENSVFSGAYEAFMKIAGNSENWGKEGSNGGSVELNCTNQTAKGPITVDDASKLQMSLANGSVFEGCINCDGAHGTVNLNLDSSSKFVLTGDTYVSSLDGDTSGIDLAGHTLYVNGVAWTK